MKTGKPTISLRAKITLLVCGVVAAALLITNILISANVSANTQKALDEKARNIAGIVAHSPVVIEALGGLRNEKQIQDFAEEIRAVTKVEFIVVMDMHSTRKSHPDPARIGQKFVGGDEAAVLAGQEYTSLAEGTLGPSLRAFAPILDPEGRQIGAVSVGILLNRVQQAVEESRRFIYYSVIFGLMVGVAGAVILARSITETMFGLEPAAIARLLEERSAMLLSVREGIIAVDNEARITLVNGEATRLLQQAGIQGDPIGKDVEAFVPNTRLQDVLRTGTAELDQEQELKGITLLTNRVPVVVDGMTVGAIATFRDKTEMRHLAEQLTGVRNYAEALRAQTHEFMNKLHVILGMVRLECYEQLSGYISGIAAEYQKDVGFIARRVRNPVLAGFILGKLSRAREMGVEFCLSEESHLPETGDEETVHELVTIVGNLVDNAMEAMADSPVRRIDLDFSYLDGMLSISVTDSGPGISEDDWQNIFLRGYSTKPGNRGLGLYLVQQGLARLGGSIELLPDTGEGACILVQVPYTLLEQEDSDDRCHDR